MSAFAWSEDDSSPDVESASSRPFWVTTAAVGASLSLVTVAGILGFRYASDEAPAPVAVSAPATTTVQPVPVAAPPIPPPPPPVTVTTVVVQSTVHVPAGQPPVQRRPLSPEMVAAYDRQFIANVQAGGGIVLNPAELTRDAHLTCAYLQQGKSVAELNQMYANASGRGLADAQAFNSLVMATYPDCP